MVHVRQESETIMQFANQAFYERAGDCQTSGFNSVRIDDELTELEEFLVMHAMNRLIERGLLVTRKDLLMEYHRYNIDNDDGSFESPISWHQDSHGGISEFVHTYILYLGISDTIKGGDLIYRGKDKEHRVKAAGGTNILMDGSVEHTIGSFSGKGVRQSVVIQLTQQ